jgi:hypothetical protein
MAELRRSLGAIEAFGFSLSIIPPTLAMAFTTTLTVQSAGASCNVLTVNQHVIGTLRSYEMADHLLLGLEPLRWLF